MKLTKTYEINDDGNCSKCECYKVLDTNMCIECIAFDRIIIKFNVFRFEKPEQCKECKDYLAKYKE